MSCVAAVTLCVGLHCTETHITIIWYYYALFIRLYTGAVHWRRTKIITPP